MDDIGAYPGWSELASHDLTDADRAGPVRPDNLAYIIYTSGSTGRPKAVAVTHAGIPALIAGLAGWYDLRADSRILQFASLSFDVSVKDMLLGFGAGVTVVVASEEQRAPGAGLTRLIRDFRVTHASLTPSVLAMLPADDLPRSLTVISGGEACTLDLIRKLAGRVTLLNGYGATEGTVSTSMWQCRPSARQVLIGRPLTGTMVYILGADLSPVAAGTEGELHISGPGVARGYLGRPGLTAERFVPCPFGAPGERMYRTGDLGRWRPDGNIECTGRADDQIKLHGLRVEPGEIEAVLLQHPAVRQCAVIAREDSPGERRLVAYLLLSAGATASSAELREHAGRVLPGYMIPAGWVILRQWPLTASGKLDWRALPVPEYPATALSRPPRPGAESILCQAFAVALKVPRVGLDDNFFELGGDSLAAARLVNRVRDELGVELRIRDIFRSATPGALAGLVDWHREDE
jgi:amino acid adenylation domain-containing protein